MNHLRRAFVIALLLAIAVPAVQGRQAPAPVTAADLTAAEMEQFLLNAKIIKRKSSKKGVTDTVIATLSDGRITHDAQIQTVDEKKTVFEAGAKTELNFKDTYRFNIGGYRLARLLGLKVPMSVKRRDNGKDAAFTWWLDDYKFDEEDRAKMKEKRMGPNPDRTSKQIALLAVFDELIQNVDRNAGNLLWTSDWTMWMIDHTRAFRLGKDIRKPDNLMRIDRALLDAMRTLSLEGLTKDMGEIMQKDELEALIARRDKIVKHFDDRIATRGEAVVLFTM